MEYQFSLFTSNNQASSFVLNRDNLTRILSTKFGPSEEPVLRVLFPPLQLFSEFSGFALPKIKDLNVMLLNKSQRLLMKGKARVIKPRAINGAQIIARVARHTFGSPMTAPYSAGNRAHI